MLASTEAFLAPLESWVKAVRAKDFAAAKREAEYLTVAGELLIIHPDFRRAFEAHCRGVDPQEALVYLSEFLVCATDSRASVLKQCVKDNKPNGL